MCINIDDADLVIQIENGLFDSILTRNGQQLKVVVIDYDVAEPTSHQVKLLKDGPWLDANVQIVGCDKIHPIEIQENPDKE